MSKYPGSVKRKRDRIYFNSIKEHGTCLCFVCKQEVKYNDISVEHITPSSLGGSNSIENLTISHRICNTKRGNKT